jgi:hypothetical protein
VKRQELEKVILAMVQSLRPGMTEKIENDLVLTQAPVYFDKIDLVYLYLMIADRFPRMKLSAKDTEGRKFNSIASIAEIVWRYCG